MLLKDIFAQDKNLLYISPNIFLFNFTIYKFFINKLRKHIKDEKFEDMKVNIAALFLYNSYFLDSMDDHQIKIKRKRKFHLMIQEELK